MDFSFRDWLLILGPLFIAVVLVHGYWRMRRTDNPLKMSLDKDFLTSLKDSESSLDDLSLLRAELPSGGARIVSSPRQAQLRLDEADEAAALSRDEATLRDEAALSRDEAALSRDHATPSRDHAALSRDEATLRDEEALSLDEAALSLDEAALSLDQRVPVLMEPVQLGDQGKNIDADEIEEAPAKAYDSAEASRSKLPERLFVINVLSNKNGFDGQALLEVMVSLGLKYGAMNVFHRYGSRPDRPLFSLVNAVEPGTFDLRHMEDLKTPGVSLFMQAHELADPASALDEMISVAESIAGELDGRLTDERRSDMTPQTLEHNRQIAREYSSKSALA